MNRSADLSPVLFGVGSRSNHEPSNWLPRLLTVCPQTPSLFDLVALIFENDAGEADVTEQTIINARMLAAAEASLE